MLDEQFFVTYSTLAITAIPIILAIVEALKRTEFVKDKYAPFISMAVGILICILLNGFHENFGGNILIGILLGLSASGLYSNIKTTTIAVATRQNRRNKAAKAKAKKIHDDI
jgi:drug/metabolite transporter (DMT)-like permease